MLLQCYKKPNPKSKQSLIPNPHNKEDPVLHHSAVDHRHISKESNDKIVDYWVCCYYDRFGEDWHAISLVLHMITNSWLFYTTFATPSTMQIAVFLLIL